MNAGGVDGPDGGFCVGVGGQQHPSRLGILIAGLLKKLDPRHTRHALIAEQQGNRLLAGLQLGQGIQGSLPAGRPHHAVGGPVLAAQVLDNGFQNAYVVIHRQQNGSRHNCQFRASGFQRG